MLRERDLEAGLADLERAAEWPAGLVARFGAWLREAPDLELFRASPVPFGEQVGVDPATAIDLFLHATKLRLLELSWELVCPGCGMAIKSLQHLREVHGQIFCGVCGSPKQVALDDYIHVTFTVSPAVRAIRHHEPARLGLPEQVLDVLVSRSVVYSDGTPWRATLERRICIVERLGPKERRDFTVQLDPGVVVGTARGTGFRFFVHPDAPADAVAVILEDGRVTRSVDAVRPGRVTLTCEARVPDACVFYGYNLQVPFELGVRGALTGKMLFHSRTYRRLFEDELLDGSSALEIREVAILFTDLKGSTALYARVGDLKAYELVREHFQCLARVIDRHGGVWIKTIGDAVMASFPDAAPAVAAALEMGRDVDPLGVQLKMGIHQGPAIAVTMNKRPDYFGQTVNIAARVQGLADGGELCVTDDVLAQPGVAELVAGRPRSAFAAALKGVTGATNVHRLR